ncbi:MAG: sugar phosphate isomerase/epimerase, partial [Bacilli bacterium]
MPKEYNYLYLKEIGITGLEVAPTRIFENNPYDYLEEATQFRKCVKENYNLNISSMQSILYGKNENMFGTKSERTILINYIKKAILFAEVLGCNNLVFGAPKNRNMTTLNDYEISIPFFSELGDYA